MEILSLMAKEKTGAAPELSQRKTSIKAKKQIKQFCSKKDKGAQRNNNKQRQRIKQVVEAAKRAAEIAKKQRGSKATKAAKATRQIRNRGSKRKATEIEKVKQKGAA